MSDGIEKLLRETLAEVTRLRAEVRAFRDEIKFLKTRFSALVQDRDEKIRMQRKEIAMLSEKLAAKKESEKPGDYGVR